MTVRGVLDVLDTIAPPHLVVQGDPQPSRSPRALLIGDADAPVFGVGVALDVTQSVVEQAKANGANLLIAHHPLIYHPVATLRADDPHPGPVVLLCVRTGMAVASAHTNWDVADGGINDVLADLLGMETAPNRRPLQITHRENPARVWGMGRIGLLREPVPAGEFLARVKTALPFPEVRTARTTSNTDKIIRTVGVCGGAGASLMDDAIVQGADAFVTSDVRHHEFMEAEARDFLLLDAGHRQTETPGSRELARRLEAELNGLLNGLLVTFYD